MKLLVIIAILLIILVGENTFILYSRKKASKEPKMSKEDRDKQKQIAKAFDNLMKYDEDIARKRGVR